MAKFKTAPADGVKKTGIPAVADGTVYTLTAEGDGPDAPALDTDTPPTTETPGVPPDATGNPPAVIPEPGEATVEAHQEPDTDDAEEPNGTDHNPNTRAETLAYEYLGNGLAWIEGIPARDLTNGEMRELSKDQRAQVRKSDLYRKPPQTAANRWHRSASEKGQEGLNNASY